MLGRLKIVLLSFIIVSCSNDSDQKQQVVDTLPDNFYTDGDDEILYYFENDHIALPARLLASHNFMIRVTPAGSTATKELQIPENATGYNLTDVIRKGQLVETNKLKVQTQSRYFSPPGVIQLVDYTVIEVIENDANGNLIRRFKTYLITTTDGLQKALFSVVNDPIYLSEELGDFSFIDQSTITIAESLPVDIVEDQVVVLMGEQSEFEIKTVESKNGQTLSLRQVHYSDIIKNISLNETIRINFHELLSFMLDESTATLASGRCPSNYNDYTLFRVSNLSGLNIDTEEATVPKEKRKITEPLALDSNVDARFFIDACLGITSEISIDFAATKPSYQFTPQVNQLIATATTQFEGELVTYSETLADVGAEATVFNAKRPFALAALPGELTIDLSTQHTLDGSIRAENTTQLQGFFEGSLQKSEGSDNYNYIADAELQFENELRVNASASLTNTLKLHTQFDILKVALGVSADASLNMKSQINVIEQDNAASFLQLSNTPNIELTGKIEAPTLFEFFDLDVFNDVELLNFNFDFDTLVYDFPYTPLDTIPWDQIVSEANEAKNIFYVNNTRIGDKRIDLEINENTIVSTLCESNETITSVEWFLNEILVYAESCGSSSCESRYQFNADTQGDHEVYSTCTSQSGIESTENFLVVVYDEETGNNDNSPDFLCDQFIQTVYEDSTMLVEFHITNLSLTPLDWYVKLEYPEQYEIIEVWQANYNPPFEFSAPEYTSNTLSPYERHVFLYSVNTNNQLPLEADVAVCGQ